MYHYIREENQNLPYFRYLHIDDFRKQLDYFGRKFKFITKDEFVQTIHTGNPIENGIILTFDDGLKDHKLVAQELFSRDLWGIFYVATSPYHTNKLLDVHRTHMLIGSCGGEAILEYLLTNINDDMLSHNHVGEFHSLTYVRQQNDEATQKCKRILNYLISYDLRSSILEKMMVEFLGNEPEISKSFYLCCDDLMHMKEQGMVIGSHSVSHPVFSKLSEKEQKQEIHDSFSYLENTIGNLSPKTFCYPYGGFHTFTDYTELCLEKEGSLFSFNVEQRNITANDLNHRRQALPRFDCNQFLYGEASMGLLRPGKNHD